MDFYEYLFDRNLEEIVQEVDFVPPTFSNEKHVISLLIKAREKNFKIRIIGDYDVDGLMCSLGVSSVLLSLGYSDVSVHKYTKRTHSLSQDSVNSAIQDKCDLVIVCDTGSNDLEMLNRLKIYGIEVIVLDHHNTTVSYEDFGINTVINTKLENKLLGTDKYELSAGALCFCVMYKLCEVLGQPYPKKYSTYATISLYADCMNMSNKLNRAIYHYSQKVEYYDIPSKIRLFMHYYKKFTRRFIEFTFSPIVNACFRAGELFYINKLFLEESTAAEQATCYQKMMEIRDTSRKNIEVITDVINSIGLQELKHFIVVDLAILKEHVSINLESIGDYTGLIANSLASRYNKTAVVYCSGSFNIKGSLRDQLGRSYLPIFKQFCEANGHDPAFGMHIKALELPVFLQTIKLIDEKFPVKGIPNTPVSFSHEFNNPDTRMISLMAQYNEFSGSGNLPISFISKTMYPDMKHRWNLNKYSYCWGDYYVDINYKIVKDQVVFAKPILSNTVKLKV